MDTLNFVHCFAFGSSSLAESSQPAVERNSMFLNQKHEGSTSFPNQPSKPELERNHVSPNRWLYPGVLVARGLEERLATWILSISIVEAGQQQTLADCTVSVSLC